jgi:hypothetical protein
LSKALDAQLEAKDYKSAGELADKIANYMSKNERNRKEGREIAMRFGELHVKAKKEFDDQTAEWASEQLSRLGVPMPKVAVAPTKKEGDKDAKPASTTQPDES